MTWKDRSWRAKPRRELDRLTGFLDWLIDFLEKDNRDYFSWRPVEDAPLSYLLAEYRAASVRVARFPNQSEALKAIELIEAEIKRRDQLEFARQKTERLEGDAVYEELKRRGELRERKRRKENFTNWSGVLQAWQCAYWRGRRCRSHPPR
jgi:hypothetical protein